MSLVLFLCEYSDISACTHKVFHLHSKQVENKRNPQFQNFKLRNSYFEYSYTMSITKI